MEIDETGNMLSIEDMADVLRCEQINKQKLVHAVLNGAAVEVRNARNALIVARVRERFQNEVTIDPGDENQLCDEHGCVATRAALIALRERLEDENALRIDEQAKLLKSERIRKGLARDVRGLSRWGHLYLVYRAALRIVRRYV